MTRLKICGLRDADNALVAARAGADLLGFNFVPGVRRQLSVDRARTVIDDFRSRHPGEPPRLVGLFADQPADEVNRAIEVCGLDLAQLCGQEPRDYWREIAAPVIKMVKVRDDEDGDSAIAETLRGAEQVVADGHTVLLDKYEAGAKGGTGKTFDWRIAAEVAESYDFLLAGGLTPANVRRAIEVVSPWGVDVSSGVETDGVKDPAKITAFAAEVKGADAAGSEPA
jgi:phosphoribosylanthranilate isomerase